MTNKTEKPLFRLTFSRITGKDADGKDILSRPRKSAPRGPAKATRRARY